MRRPMLVLALSAALSTQAQTYAVLHRFRGTDGSDPRAGLIADAGRQPVRHGLTLLHSFGTAPDGANPWAGLLLDSAGNLYGRRAAASSTMYALGDAGRCSRSRRREKVYGK